MMFGGAVKGKRILGKYPDDLTSNGKQNIGRGRLIPTTPWDACFQGIADWLGIPMSHMNDVLPNREMFTTTDASQMFTANDMFET